jgi:hypothetical protein
MKKFIQIISLVLLASPAFAQENYTVPANAGNVTQLRQIIGAHNALVFDGAVLPIGSTQAQVCTALSIPGGASCTAAAARSRGARIYADSQAGREEYLIFELALPGFLSKLATVPASNVVARCVVFAAMNQTDKNTELAALGQPTGTSACPYR